MITVDFIVNLTDIGPFRGWRFGNEAWDPVVHGILYGAVSAEVDIEGLFAFRANVYAVGALHIDPELSRIRWGRRIAVR
jgi:hypothetical protein